LRRLNTYLNNSGSTGCRGIGKRQRRRRSGGLKNDIEALSRMLSDRAVIPWIESSNGAVLEGKLPGTWIDPSGMPGR
jgi:hypothetical protein